MALEKVFSIKRKINKKITKDQVKEYLEELLNLNFAKRSQNKDEYQIQIFK
jgi:hypothetical protein